MPDERTTASGRGRPGRPAADRAGRRAATHGAILAGYAGMEHKHLAFALALVLDELARHVRSCGPEVRSEGRARCRMLLNEQPSKRPVLRQERTQARSRRL